MRPSRFVGVERVQLSCGHNPSAGKRYCAEASVAGVSKLRHDIVDAWGQKANFTVSFSLVRVHDVELGLVIITLATFGSD